MMRYTQFFSLAVCFTFSMVFNVSADEKINLSSGLSQDKKQVIDLTTLDVKQQRELRKSNEKDRIRTLQRSLIEEGYYFGSVDGVMSLKLRRAANSEIRDRD